MAASVRKNTYSNSEMSLVMIMGVSLYCIYRLMEIEMKSRNPSNPR